MRHNIRTLLFVIVLSLCLGFVSAQNYTGGRTATLQGTVTTFDSVGNRLPLPWVRINATGLKFNLTVYTDGNGFYQMILPPGTYRVTTYLLGYSTQFVNVTLAPGQFMVTNFYLRWEYVTSPVPA